MKKMIDNLSEIRAWIEQPRDISRLTSNDEFMKLIVELMNFSLYLLRVGASLAPSDRAAESGYSKRAAIIVAHMVRTAKLYEGALVFVADGKGELAAIFIRLAMETVVRMEYMIQSKAKSSTSRSFVVTSYRPEKEIVDDLGRKARTRALTPIEERIIRKIRSRLRQDRISLKALRERHRWELDGKNFRTILGEVWSEDLYSYAFGSGSHSVHGDWYDLSQYHLARAGGRYQPKLTYEAPDPRYACPLTAICLRGLTNYLRWSQSDPDGVVSSIAERLQRLNLSLDRAHEKYLSR